MTTMRLHYQDEQIKEVQAIRSAVFCEEQGVSPQQEQDAYDSDMRTRYVLVKEGDNALGCGRMVWTEKGLKIGRIAVLKAARGRGVGSIIVQALWQEALAAGETSVYVYAQLHAVAFYKTLGFRLVSREIITENGLPHQEMRREQNET